MELFELKQSLMLTTEEKSQQGEELESDHESRRLLEAHGRIVECQIENFHHQEVQSLVPPDDDTTLPPDPDEFEEFVCMPSLLRLVVVVDQPP